MGIRANPGCSVGFRMASSKWVAGLIGSVLLYGT